MTAFRAFRAELKHLREELAARDGRPGDEDDSSSRSLDNLFFGSIGFVGKK